MGDKNHLHVCRHCGNVMATASEQQPRVCTDCGDDNFSLFLILPKTIAEEPAGSQVTWRLYGEFAREAGSNVTEVRIDGPETVTPTVKAALEGLLETNPRLRDLILTETGELRGNSVITHNHVNVYNEPDDLETPLQPKDTLGLFPRIR